MKLFESPYPRQIKFSLVILYWKLQFWNVECFAALNFRDLWQDFARLRVFPLSLSSSSENKILLAVRAKRLAPRSSSRPFFPRVFSFESPTTHDGLTERGNTCTLSLKSSHFISAVTVYVLCHGLNLENIGYDTVFVSVFFMRGIHSTTALKEA